VRDHHPVVVLLFSWLLVCVPGPAHALDPDRAMSQYIRDRWESDRGYPGGAVYGMAQTPDGYLWIAAEKGLVRFDGLTFLLVDPRVTPRDFGPTVLGVAAAPDGSVWARLRGPALVRYRHGSFTTVPTGNQASVVTAMVRTRDGSLLLSPLGQGAMVHRDGRLAPIGPPGLARNSLVLSIAETTAGDVWLGTFDAGLIALRGSTATPITEDLPDRKINCLLAGENGELWIGTDRGVMRWSGTAPAIGTPAGLAGVPALALARDSESNIWIAAGARGLLRFNSRGLTSLERQRERARADVTAVFEDRDRNLWVGTAKGIERLRDGVFTTYSAGRGLPGESAGPVYVDTAERTWFGPPAGGLYWLRDGVVTRVTSGGLGDDVIYSITGSDGEVWAGRQRGGVMRLDTRGDRFTSERFTETDGLAQNSVYSVYRARDGAVWAGTLSGGVSRIHKGHLTTYGTANGLTSNSVTAIVETVDGSIWFGTPSGISALTRDSWRRYGTSEGLPANDVNTLFEDGGGTLWAGTTDGLAFLRAGQFVAFPDGPPVLRGSILGIAADRGGWLWVASADRVVRVRPEALLRGRVTDADVHEYGVADGLPGTEGVKRTQSVVADPRGRIWLSLTGGLSVVDPARATTPAMPALTHIENVSADGSTLALGDTIRIPSGRRRVSVSYTGLSLSVPERMRFRYRLDGFDADWGAPVTERHVAYTNLGPGEYVFRVTASNSDGLWNGAEATTRLDVAPMIWQTAWFRFSAILLGCAGAWGIYRLRVLQVARGLNLRFEERLDERTRIAQELHDTLLQGFLSASMQLHVAAESLPESSPARASLERVLDLMRRVIEEGRTALRGLRSATSTPDDLAQAFAGIQQEFAVTGEAEYRVIVEGQPRALVPTIRDEVYRIVREALVNAFRHSGAARVELELEYTPGGLNMLVRDDGRGIDPRVVSMGTAGHWGLPGMRERAERIGARLKVSTRLGAGTEVELSIPAAVAFGPSAHGRRGGWRARLSRRPAGAPTEDNTERTS
jgi:signal transduction histidine kinase/ligand-binding sensor domain-containing protein